MTDKAVPRTIRTYDKIAQAYRDRWRDRSAIQIHLNRFVDLLGSYALTRYPVIDIGCGPGFDAAKLRQQGLEVIGLDLSWSMMATGRQEYPGAFIQADMCSLPLARKVGGLWVSASMLHLPRALVPAALDGFYDVLVPGGVLYLSLKHGQGQEWTESSLSPSSPRFFTYWQSESLDHLLKAAGFQIIDGWLGSGVAQTTWLMRFARKVPQDSEQWILGDRK